MTLPNGFLFSQSNLQDYVDCQRRFQLRHILRLAWPAVEAEPFLENERRIDLGLAFHKIVHQHLVGVSEDQIARSIGDDEVVQSWWHNYLHSIGTGVLEMIDKPGNRCFEEITLSIPLGDYRLIAKYDLLVIDTDNKLVIFDWKTSQNHPKRLWLANRVQTHVYPFVLIGAAVGLVGGKLIDPAQVEMIYWFANQPEQPERFEYSQPAYNADSEYLTSLVTAISQKADIVFPLTPDERRCQFCTYRSLCNRGITPGEVIELETWEESDQFDDVSLDIDQIGEIEY
jgi:PD-(D/E)XK nuclease superfamily